jgi:hypothetical protein
VSRTTGRLSALWSFPGELLGEMQLDRVLERAEPTTKFAVALLGKDRLVALKRLDQRQHRGAERRQRDACAPRRRRR